MFKKPAIHQDLGKFSLILVKNEHLLNEKTLKIRQIWRKFRGLRNYGQKVTFRPTPAALEGNMEKSQSMTHAHYSFAIVRDFGIN